MNNTNMTEEEIINLFQCRGGYCAGQGGSIACGPAE